MKEVEDRVQPLKPQLLLLPNLVFRVPETQNEVDIHPCWIKKQAVTHHYGRVKGDHRIIPEWLLRRLDLFLFHLWLKCDFERLKRCTIENVERFLIQGDFVY